MLGDYAELSHPFSQPMPKICPRGGGTLEVYLFSFLRALESSASPNPSVYVLLVVPVQHCRTGTTKKPLL